MKKRTKKTFWISLAVIIVTIGVTISLVGNGDEAVLIQADLVFVDEISEIVTASGRVQPQTKVDITAEVSAQVIELHVSEGDWVSKGQDLLLLDTIQLKSDVAQARYTLDEITARATAARSQFDKDKLECDRQTSLFEKQLTSETAFTNAKFAMDNSRANLEAMQAQTMTARARLDKMQDNLNKASISAPMNGVITYLNVEVGEIAQAQTAYTQGKRLMTIADLSVFEVEIDVDETEVAKVHDAQHAEIRVDAFRDTVFAGIVEEIGNSAIITGEGTENYTTNFHVKVRFVDSNVDIRPGMSATVDITTSSQDNALLIPYASVVTREFDPDSLKRASDKSSSDGLIASVEAAEVDSSNNSTEMDDTTDEDSTTSMRDRKRSRKIKKTGVFVVHNGLAKFVDVETGIADEQYTVALNGVNPGDTVISGSFKTLRTLKDGDPVRIDENSIEEMNELFW